MSAVAQHPRLAEIIARRKLREGIERAVGKLIDALDALEPDADAEPWLGVPELPATCRAVMFRSGTGWTRTPPLEWARGVNDDREHADEHGGDILDEMEHELGWAANVSQLGLGLNTGDGGRGRDRARAPWLRLRAGRAGRSRGQRYAGAGRTRAAEKPSGG